jgi:hypothetical protein
MTDRRWILLTIASVVTVVGIVAAIAYGIDPYGVLRDPTGRKLVIYYSERKAKLLMNVRYVPTDFDGLFLGESQTVNWHLPTLAGVKIYNESLQGGCASEERFLVNRALGKGHFKLAIFTLGPPMTAQHSFMDGLDTVKTSEAIWSIHAFANETADILAPLHLQSHRSNTFPDGTIPIVARRGIYVRVLDASYFHFDPTALDDYRGMVQDLRDRGSTVVYLIPPIYRQLYDLNKASYEIYKRTLLQQLPRGSVIDFNASEYATLTSDPNNYFDCFHLTSKGAATFSTLLGKLVPDAMTAGH